MEKTGGEFDQYHNLAPIFDTYGLIPYSLSMDIKVNKNGQVLVYMQNGSYSKYRFVSQWVNATTEYQRFKFENLTPVFSTSWQQNTPNDNRAMLATYTTYGSTVYPTVRNVQVEPKTYATPFVSGTRGGTVASGGGLIDLTGNNRHGELVNNPRYNSSNFGSISFDGVDDYIITDYDLSWNNTNSAAIEFFCKPNSSTQRAGIIGKPSPDWEWSIMHGENGITNSSLTFVYWTTGGGHTNGPVINISNFFSTEWVHVAVSWNHTTSETSIYKNGILQRTDSWTAPSTNQNRTNNIYLGGAIYTWNTGYWNGNIALFKVYNRSISANEVWRNFNALRGRFRI